MRSLSTALCAILMVGVALSSTMALAMMTPKEQSDVDIAQERYDSRLRRDRGQSDQTLHHMKRLSSRRGVGAPSAMSEDDARLESIILDAARISRRGGSRGIEKTTTSSSGGGRLRKGTTAATAPPVTSAPKLGTMGISVREFGATGDPNVDATEALQSAFDYCIVNEKTCLIPAGHYSISKPLQLTVRNGKIRIVGEGKYNTAIQVMSNVTYFPGPLINISYTPPNYESGMLELSEFQLTPGHQADYGIYAPLITRSYFNNLYFLGGIRYGFFLAGWIIIINQCSFDSSRLAGLLVAGNNMVIQSSSFESNIGHGIYAPWSDTLTITNSVIEGNQGFGLYVNGVSGLTINNNYFERNCGAGPVAYNVSESLGYGHVMSPKYATDLVADIVLGNGKFYPNRGVRITGCTFAPDGRPGQNYTVTAVVFAGVSGATVENNGFGGLPERDPMFYADLGSSPLATIKLRDNHYENEVYESDGIPFIFPLGIKLVNQTQLGLRHGADFLKTWTIEGFAGKYDKPLFSQSAFEQTAPYLPQHFFMRFNSSSAFATAPQLSVDRTQVLRPAPGYWPYQGAIPSKLPATLTLPAMWTLSIPQAPDEANLNMWSAPLGIVIQTPNSLVPWVNGKPNFDGRGPDSQTLADIQSAITPSLCNVPLVASVTLKIWNASIGDGVQGHTLWFSFLAGNATNLEFNAESGEIYNARDVSWTLNRTIDSYYVKAMDRSQGVFTLNTLFIMECNAVARQGANHTSGEIPPEHLPIAPIPYGAAAFAFQMKGTSGGFTPTVSVWDFTIAPLGAPPS